MVIISVKLLNLVCFEHYKEDFWCVLFTFVAYKHSPINNLELSDFIDSPMVVDLFYF